MKKDLQELTWVSYVLFGSIAIFLVTNFILLTFDPHFATQGFVVEIFYPAGFWDVVSAFAATVTAYSYQQNVFPIFTELKVKTNEEYKRVSYRALPTTMTIYLIV